ncbi:unnamed protein product [Blepharisma stoltei]|uniref:Uncharacterized protein n=1 Tax=Blepharisma stoltei TaxID=1481888 RepID=A0AAU9KCL0_9CILI|nr:unnamed protein product [Blepharisma stoltei]
MDRADKNFWEKYNQKFNKLSEPFRGNKEYEEVYEKLARIRNQLTVCSSNWEAVCQEKTNRLNEILNDRDPKKLEENCHRRCREYFSNPSMHDYTKCIMESKLFYLSELLGEMAKQSKFLEAMGNTSI